MTEAGTPNFRCVFWAAVTIEAMNLVFALAETASADGD